VPSCHVQYVGREPSGILPQHTRRQQRRSPRPHLRCLPSRCAKHGAHQLCTLGKWSSILHRGVEGQGDRSRIRCQFTCWVSLNSQSQFVGVLVLVLDVIAVRLVEVELHAWCKCVCVVCRSTILSTCGRGNRLRIDWTRHAVIAYRSSGGPEP